MAEPQVHVLVGMIASGKSTYAANCARSGFVVVNDDSLVTSVHGGDYGLYDASLKPLYKSAGLNLFMQAVALGRSVVIDTGSRNRKTRQRWVSLAHAFDVPIYAIAFPVESPEVHARRRADADGRGFGYDKWLAVADHHFEEFEPVSNDEGFQVIVRPQWDDIKSGWHYRSCDKEASCPTSKAE